VCAPHVAQGFDLIVLDLQIPVMDGFAVMEGLRLVEHGSYLPVLVITAQPGHTLRALETGAKDFISKPFGVAGTRRCRHRAGRHRCRRPAHVPV
jgi:CheY-like chemotaxis protein